MRFKVTDLTQNKQYRTTFKSGIIQ